MGIEVFLWWFFAAMSVLGALFAVLSPSIVRAVFSLMFAFGGVCGIYAIAGADFLAILQLVVYVGGVLVLFVFGILLTGRTAQALGDKEVRHRPMGLIIGAAIFVGLLTAITDSVFHLKPDGAGVAAATSEPIGKLLLGDYIIAFEFASVLLLIALVGAAYLVRRSEA